MNLVFLNNEMTNLMNEKSALDVVRLNFNKAFDTVSYNIITDNLINYGLGEWTVRQTGNWLNWQASMVVINGTKISWRSATSGSVCQALLLGL